MSKKEQTPKRSVRYRAVDYRPSPYNRPCNLIVSTFRIGLTLDYLWLSFGLTFDRVCIRFEWKIELPRNFVMRIERLCRGTRYLHGIVRDRVHVLEKHREFDATKFSGQAFRTCSIGRGFRRIFSTLLRNAEFLIRE